MIIRALLALLLPLAVGFLLICRLWPARQPLRAYAAFKASLSVGLGFGIFSCTFLIWLSVFGASPVAFWLAQGVLLVALAATLFGRFKVGSAALPPEPAAPHPPLKFGWVLSAAFFIALISAVVAFTFLSVKNPHGGWDAWSVHNMKARFIFRAGANWKDTFSSALAWSSLDYPLLISLTIAGSWSLAGSDTVIIPVLVAMLFTFAAVGVACSSISILRSPAQGKLAGLTLLGSPFLIMHGANQYLDIPLAYFFLATLALLSLQDHLPESRTRLLILAGLAAGFSAWTKNEGLLFVLAVTVSWFALSVIKQGFKAGLRRTLIFLMGGAPVFLVILYFKARFGAANLLFTAQEVSAEGSTVEKLLNSSRYWYILNAFKQQFLTLGLWVVPVVGVLCLYLLLFGFSREWKNPNAVAALVAVCLMLMGYFFIFVITPFRLTWHLDTTLDRLMIQLWPSLVFVFFFFVRTPEEMKANNQARLSVPLAEPATPA